MSNPSDTDQSSAQNDGFVGMLRDAWTTITQNVFPTSVVIVAFIFVFGLIAAIWRAKDVISPLAEAQYARGLITFLIAFAAILIAVILTLFTVLSKGSDEDEEKRFNRGREVLTIF